MSQPPVQQSNDEFLNIGQAAQMLGVSTWTLRNWDKAGRLKPLRHPKNGYRIYRREQLQLIVDAGGNPGRPGERLAPRVDWDEGVRPSEHIVQFYETDAFLMDSVAAFVAPALASGDSAILIATEAHRQGLERRLTARGLDHAAAAAQGRYCALDAAGTLLSLMTADVPDPIRFEQIVGQKLRQLAHGGARRVRAFGEMVALLWSEGKRDAAIRLEHLWNDLATRQPFALLCAYPINGFAHVQDDVPLADVCSCHTRVIPSESYGALPSGQQRLRAIAQLQHKAKVLEAEVAHRREVERVLVQRERELAESLDNAVAGIHQVGPDGIIRWANRTELKMLGFAPEEYIGHHVGGFHDDAEVAEDMLARLRRGDRLINYPCRMRCKDGSIKHVRVDSNACIMDGRFQHARCFTRDVTEHERAQARLAAIIESSDDAIVSKTLQGMIVSWNRGAERLFGYAEAEAVGQSITMIIPPERIDEERLILSRLSRGEHVSHFETVRVRKDGTRVQVSLSVSPVRDSSGKIIGASKIARDISERRRVDEALRRATAAAEAASRAKDQFLAVLSHELRTPLTPALLAVESMRADPHLPPQFHDALAMVQRNIALETRLIDDLLDLSRVINGKMPLHRQDVRVHELVGEVLQMVRDDVERKELRVALELAAADDRVRADPARLHQLLWNLLKNAVKFTPTHGQITVRTRHAEAADQVLIDVQDSGVGIDPQAIHSIFDPFDQGEHASDRGVGGLGLGLAICKAVAELHGGSIAATSAGKGRGATFTVTLPAARSSTLHSPRVDGTSNGDRNGNGDGNAPATTASRRILLVDDHPDTLAALRRLLQMAGHVVATATSVADAVQQAQNTEFDLLISDIGLPDGTGLDVMRRVRALCPQLHGIALSGYGMEVDIERSAAAGFSAHLTKPLEMPQLQGAIERILATYRE